LVNANIVLALTQTEHKSLHQNILYTPLPYSKSKEAQRFNQHKYSWADRCVECCEFRLGRKETKEDLERKYCFIKGVLEGALGNQDLVLVLVLPLICRELLGNS
jgi:hypothetical protein